MSLNKRRFLTFLLLSCMLVLLMVVITSVRFVMHIEFDPYSQQPFSVTRHKIQEQEQNNKPKLNHEHIIPSETAKTAKAKTTLNMNMNMNLNREAFASIIPQLAQFQRTNSTSTESEKDARPNILFLFPDQWRFDWSDNYFHPTLALHLPTLANIYAQGTRFLHTAVASPLCAPSRACLATGREFDFAGVFTTHEDSRADIPTFYQLMRANDYWMMISGKDDLTKESGCGIEGDYRLEQLGFDDQRRCKGKSDVLLHYPTITDPFGKYLATQHSYSSNSSSRAMSDWNITRQCYHTTCCVVQHSCPNSLRVQPQSYEDNWITEQTLDILQSMKKSQTNTGKRNKPWFLQVNYAGPHPPFIILESMRKQVINRSFIHSNNISVASNVKKPVLQNALGNYAAEIENLDVQFGRILHQLDIMHELNNTIVCVSSDHGEMLGDFNMWDKRVPWVASTNVPLVCMGADIQANVQIETYVTNMDLAATFLDYSRTPKLAQMTAVSLRPFLNGSWTDAQHSGYRTYVSSGLEQWRMVVEDVNASHTWKYICCRWQCPTMRKFPVVQGLVHLLFNVKQDLYERQNIYERFRDVARRLRSYIPLNFCVTPKLKSEAKPKAKFKPKSKKSQKKKKRKSKRL